MGNAMWHSGTLAAAKQAVLLGVRGAAFSAPEIDDAEQYEPLRPWIGRVFDALLGMPQVRLANVNFPAGAPRGLEWTRQSVRQYQGFVEPAKDPLGRPIFWLMPRPREGPEPGTDRHAVEAGNVSITALRLDLTDERALPSIA